MRLLGITRKKKRRNENMETKLIASSGTKEGIIGCIAQYLCGESSNYRLDKQPDGTYQVFSKNRNMALKSMVVVQIKNRWRLENK